MQRLDIDIIAEVRRAKMKQLEENIRMDIVAAGTGGMIECPFCHYISKNKRFSAKVFPDNSFKCFACGIWRKL